MSLDKQKAALRRQYKIARDGLTAEIRQKASTDICRHLSAWEVFQEADAILTYMPMHSEVDLRPLLEAWPKKRWLLPRILPGQEGLMVIQPYKPGHLIRHSYGMEEPAPYLPQAQAGEIELVLIPGLAFDQFGWRLGYGGGYYDRFLSRFKRVGVGVVFRALLQEHLPHGAHDVPVGWVATESGVFETEKKSQSG